MWFFFEYKSKNDLNLYAGDHPEEERKKYGYNSSGTVNQREADIERSFRYEARDIAAAGTIDDYKTVTYRQFAESMGIDYDKMDIPEGDDNIYKNILSHHTMEVKESDLRFEVYNTLSTTFAKYFVSQGEDAETEKMTEEQKRLLRQGQIAGQRAESVSDEGIEQWIASEGEQLGDELLLATRISNMKDARYRTQFAGSFGCDSDGFLTAEIKKEAARTRFIGEIVGKKKDFEQVKEGILSRANKKFYEAVKTCAELREKLEGKTKEEKERAYSQANLNVFEAARQYMDGKESVRSNRSPEDYSGRNRNNNIVNEPADVKNGPGL